MLGGLFFGAVFSAFGVLALAFRSAELTDGFWVSVVLAAGTYLLSGAAGGAVLYFSKPILRRRSGPAVVGMLIFLPVTLLISVPHGLDSLGLGSRIAIAVFVAALFGSVIGPVLLPEQ